jgi:hypothetical protein
MLQFYDIQVESPPLRLFCRVKKRTLTIVSECQTIWLKLYWNEESHLILEEVQIKIQNNQFKPSVNPDEIIELLNPCLVIGFYTFPQATEILLDYSWTFIKDEHRNYETWSLGLESIQCSFLPKLNLKIQTLEKEIDWEAPTIMLSHSVNMLVYS